MPPVCPSSQGSEAKNNLQKGQAKQILFPPDRQVSLTETEMETGTEMRTGTEMETGTEMRTETEICTASEMRTGAGICTRTGMA